MANLSNPTTPASPASNMWGDFIQKLPFSEHLDKLPAPVKGFIDRRPGTAIGIAVLAGLGLMVMKRR